MFGSSPAGFLKFAPHSYKLVSRGCGRITVSAEQACDVAALDRSATLTYFDFPSEFPLALVKPMLLGTPESVLDFLEYDGHCVEDSSTSTELRVSVRWRSCDGRVPRNVAA